MYCSHRQRTGYEAKLQRLASYISVGLMCLLRRSVTAATIRGFRNDLMWAAKLGRFGYFNP
jgi:hypothetical protein